MAALQQIDELNFEIAIFTRIHNLLFSVHNLHSTVPVCVNASASAPPCTSSSGVHSHLRVSPLQRSICLLRSVAAADQLQGKLLIQWDQNFQLMYELKVNKCRSLASLGYPQCHELTQGLILLSCDMCGNPPIEVQNLFPPPSV